MEKIGGKLADSVMDATHVVVVAGTKTYLSLSLLFALNSGLPFIVNENWLIDSAKRTAGRKPKPIYMDPSPTYGGKSVYSSVFIKYVYHDGALEDLYGFKLTETLSLKRPSNFLRECVFIVREPKYRLTLNKWKEVEPFFLILKYIYIYLISL